MNRLQSFLVLTVVVLVTGCVASPAKTEISKAVLQELLKNEVLANSGSTQKAYFGKVLGDYSGFQLKTSLSMEIVNYLNLSDRGLELFLDEDSDIHGFMYSLNAGFAFIPQLTQFVDLDHGVYQYHHDKATGQTFVFSIFKRNSKFFLKELVLRNNSLLVNADYDFSESDVESKVVYGFRPQYRSLYKKLRALEDLATFFAQSEQEILDKVKITDTDQEVVEVAKKMGKSASKKQNGRSAELY